MRFHSNILFDLDGTLIDSSQGILNSFRRVLEAHKLEPRMPLDQQLIGLPLPQSLARLTGLVDAEQLTILATAFKAIYDSEGYLNTQPYPNLVPTLSALTAASQRRLFIVTNKRLLPTRQILEVLKINHFLVAVYTLDTWQPTARDKVEMISRILIEWDLNARDCVMVGDSSEDAAAAAAYKLAFIAVAYGYGDAARQANYPITAQLDVLTDLPGLLNKMQVHE